MREYWIVIRRRKRLLFVSVLACLMLAVALNEFTTPVYLSSARVQVEPDANRSVLTGSPTGSSSPRSDNEAVLTTAEAATSRILLALVAARLERQGIPVGRSRRGKTEFSTPVQAATPGVANTPAGSGTTGPRPPEDLEHKVDWLVAHLIVEPVRDTRLIRINVEDSDPRTAAQIANAIAENLVNYKEVERSGADSSLASYLRTQAADVKRKIETLERQANDSKQPGLFSLDGKIRQLTESIAQLNDSYTKTRLRRLEVLSQLAQLQDASRDNQVDPKDIPIHTETLDALRRDLLASNTALAKARDMYGALHPKLVALQSENDAIRRNIRAEVASAVVGLGDERAVLSAREQSLLRAIDQTERELDSVNARAERFRSTDEEAKTDRDLYNLLIARVHEAEITGDSRRAPLRIIEPASVNSAPVRPRKAFNLVIGLLLGLLSGVGLAFLLESIRRTIRTPQDVDAHLKLPVLGLIPKDVLR